MPANGSAPTRPTMRTRPPSRAAAIAWFRPLPPAPIASPFARSVSPGRTKRGTRTDTSTFRLPTTAMSRTRASYASAAAGAREWYKLPVSGYSVVEVAVPVPVEETFDYALGDGDRVEPGARVLVPH